jgi:hypothetical protein
MDDARKKRSRKRDGGGAGFVGGRRERSVASARRGKGKWAKEIVALAEAWGTVTPDARVQPDHGFRLVRCQKKPPRPPPASAIRRG